MATDRNDELLVKIHHGQKELLAVLGDIRDRLPVPTSIEVVSGEPGQVKLREPAAPGEAPAGDNVAAPKAPRKAAARRTSTSAKTSGETP